MSNDQRQSKTHKGEYQVRLRWGSPEGLETEYVNQLAITHTDSEFYLIFGELPFPPILEGDEAPEELIILPRVRLAITPDTMKVIAQVIQENVDKYQMKRGQYK